MSPFAPGLAASQLGLQEQKGQMNMKQSDASLELPPEVIKRHKAYLKAMDNSQVRRTCSEVARISEDLLTSARKRCRICHGQVVVK